ncbi:major outer membrane protein, partial [Campylobacter mucosalis]|uniref:major outer membrane protein n=1 Tax=Campylobacter mucosalis TaxID=202 RepID=UPI00146FE789
VYQLYLGYQVGNTTITAGKQVLGTFFTDDEVGTGIKVVNQDITGLTLAALAVDALDYDTYEADGGLLEGAKSVGYKPGNLYGVAAIGSYDPVAFQLWYVSLEKVTDLLAVELSGNFAVNDNVSFGAKGQFVNSNADSKAKKTIDDYNDGNFYAAELSTSLFGADLSAGYVGWKVKNRGITSFSLEDQGELIEVGEQNYYDYTAMQGKGNFWFVTAGYTFDKFFVGADYKNGIRKFADPTLTKEKHQEYVARLGYEYSKKLVFSTFYSAVKTKNTEGEKGDTTKSNQYRFEAKYSF